MLVLPISTDDGEFVARYSAQGLCELNFPKSSGAKGATRDESVPEKIRQWHRLTTKALLAALKGKTPEQMPPMDLSAGTDFQQRVWKVLRSIATGDTLSYGDVAKTMGQSKAVRAVGGACGANPIPVLVPCHRVLAANKKIGGFSGGLDWKRKLLEREGIAKVGSW